MGIGRYNIAHAITFCSLQEIGSLQGMYGLNNNIGTHIACMSYFEMKCFDSACGELLQLLSLVSLVIFMLRSFWKSNSL